MSEAEAIARMLSAAHFNALMRHYSWDSEIAEDEGEKELWNLGLWEHVRKEGVALLQPTKLGKEVLEAAKRLGWRVGRKTSVWL